MASGKVFYSQPDEVISNTWLAVADYADTYDGRAEFRTWIDSIAEEECYQHTRWHKRQKERQAADGPEGKAQLEDAKVDHQPPVPEQVIEQEIADDLAAALETPARAAKGGVRPHVTQRSQLARRSPRAHRPLERARRG